MCKLPVTLVLLKDCKSVRNDHYCRTRLLARILLKSVKYRNEVRRNCMQMLDMLNAGRCGVKNCVATCEIWNGTVKQKSKNYLLVDC